MTSYVYLSGSGLSIVSTFTQADWLAYSVAVVSLLAGQRSKIVMSKHLSAPAQQPLSYLSLVFSSFADIFIFSVVFNGSQICGIAISLLGPLIQLVYLLSVRDKSVQSA